MRMRERRIEEVKEFTYVGYTLQKNGSQEAQVRNRESSCCDGAGMEYRKKKVWEELREEVMVI